jgi:hypothetical protein
VVEVVVLNRHQDHQELVETVVVELEEMLLMVQLELQTLEVAVELDLEELILVDLTLQAQVVQVSWLQEHLLQVLILFFHKRPLQTKLQLLIVVHVKFHNLKRLQH